MTTYAILIYADPERESLPGEGDAHDRHAKELDESGAMVAAFALEPVSTATAVRGDIVTDGPFVDSKEVVAGICVIEAPDLDAALAIARANPITQQGGGVELRPVQAYGIPDRGQQPGATA